MPKIKNLVVLLTISTISVGLYFLFKPNSTSSEVQLSTEIPLPHQQTKSELTTESQPTTTGQDPFKKFLDEKSNNLSSTVKSENIQISPMQPGQDPFKEFLEKQKQTTKDQVVSPFGRN
jgi:hypothetical protein